jgi:phage terminase large subunit GpA-like protein
MTIEQLETKYQRGFAVQRWIKPNGGRNEALDCRVYAYAAFKMTNGKYRSVANSVAPRQIKRRVRQK